MKQDIIAASTAALLAGALLLPITMPRTADAAPGTAVRVALANK